LGRRRERGVLKQREEFIRELEESYGLGSYDPDLKCGSMSLSLLKDMRG